MSNSLSRAQCTLILPDMHFPHQCDQALATVLAAKAALRPDRIVCLGDNLDGARFSSHPVRTYLDRAPGFLSGEVGPLNTYLDKLQGRNSIPLVYLEGNHEQRIERQALKLGAMGEDLYMLASPERLIRHRVDAHGKPRRERKDLTWRSYYGKSMHSMYMLTPELKHASALGAIHGWSYAKNAARQVLACSPDVSIVFGHVHRAMMASRRFVVGPREGISVRAQSFGCLAGLCPTYSQHAPNEWTHGFGVLYVWEHTWALYHVEIARDGSCILPSGKIVVG